MADARETALALLDQCRIATLATAGPEGPWASPVFYAHQGFSLVFVSSGRSRHAEYLAADPRCSVAVHTDGSDWRSIRGIQMAGRVDRLSGIAKVSAMARYLRRFPFLEAPDTPAGLRKALAGITWYGFEPESVYLVDNSRGFGRVPVTP